MALMRLNMSGNRNLKPENISGIGFCPTRFQIALRNCSLLNGLSRNMLSGNKFFKDGIIGRTRSLHGMKPWVSKRASTIGADGGTAGDHDKEKKPDDELALEEKK